jgi:hypothetical protein
MTGVVIDVNCCDRVGGITSRKVIPPTLSQQLTSITTPVIAAR